MIRVLHVITGLEVGGAELMLWKLLAGMDRERFESHVVSLMDGGMVGDEIRALGVPVHELDMRMRWPSPIALYRLTRIINSIRPQVVQGWMYHGNLAAWLARWVAPRAMVVWNIRQSLYDLAWEKPGTRAVIRFCAGHVTGVARILYNSETSRRQHEAIGYRPDLGETIPNGFDTEKLRPDPAAPDRVRKMLGVEFDVVLIGLVARFHPLKDHGNFLAAATRLLARHPNAGFVLVGRGLDDGNKAITRQIATNGLKGKVFLLGERDDVAALTPGLDIATSSSKSEAFPNAIGEAMSCGVPCVVTDVGDCAQIVGDTGLVVPPGSAQALAAAWAELIEMGAEKRRALGERARLRVQERYALASVVGRYENLYIGLTGRG